MSQKWFYYNLVTLSATEFDDDPDGYTVSNMEDSFYPLSNLNNNQTVKEFRTSSTAGNEGSFVIDLGGPYDADSVLISGNQATGNFPLTTVTLEANSSLTSSPASWSSPAFTTTLTSGELDEEESFGYKAFGQSVQARYWRVTVENTAGSYAGLSNLFIGEETTFTNNAVTYGWSFSRVDRSSIQEGRYGQRYIDRISDQKSISGAYQYLNVTEKEIWQDMIDYCGKYRPVWFVLDANENITQNKDIEAGYFYFDSRPTLVNTAFGLYDSEFTLIQVI